MKYTVYEVDGNSRELSVPSGDEAELLALQNAVGGYIELSNIQGSLVYVNEDGIRLKLPENKKFPQFLGPVIVMEKES